MKKILVIIVNIFIMSSVLVFVFVYSGIEAQKEIEIQIEHFENTTITMEHVTVNYLEGEQRICDVWAHYINSENMTIDDAISFIKVSHVLPDASAHIVYLDTLTGFSTRSRTGEIDTSPVAYNNIDFLKESSWINPVGETINISRAYTNPVNGEQSIAFCNCNLDNAVV